MSDIIHLLPDAVANQIAAGEVIQRPASVVKELMENALDAEATSIQVILKDAGRTLIQIIDNGKGMSMSDARMAFERHATSKIRQAEDLFALQTMGFRGEALASIAAIAQVELKTQRKSDEIGTHICISGSEFESQEPVSTSIGANFMVKNIFYNIPARRKFLKSNQTELSNVINEFERIALVNPDISFSLYHNDNEQLNLPATILRQRIISLFGKSLNQQLLSVDVDTSLISISGYIGRPEAARKKNALQYFFVNGRYMRHPYFHKAVMQSYEQLIPQGEAPNYFLYLRIDPANIDVNIHPTKTEIKFENESFLWQIINAAVKEALGKFSAVPSIDFDMTDAPDIPVMNHPQESIRQPKPQFDTSYNPFNSAKQPKAPTNWQSVYNGMDTASDFMNSGGKASNPIDISQLDMPYGQDVEVNFEGDPDYFHTDDVFQAPTPVNPIAHEVSSSQEVFTSSASTETVTPSQPKLFGSAKYADGLHYQLKGKYILTSVKSGLMMIDQHRAHVRVLFEQYMEFISNKKGISQGVLFPEMITISPSDIPVFETILPDLHFLGFDLNNMGGGTFSLNGIPSGVEGVQMVELIEGMIHTAKEKARDVKADIHEFVALRLAEAAAIPYGQVLGVEEMEKLIDDLFASNVPNFTPDGKAIISVLSNEEIAKRFK